MTKEEYEVTQAVLTRLDKFESGWGASTLSKAPNYNLFGIKGSYNGQSVYMDTWEYLKIGRAHV